MTHASGFRVQGHVHSFSRVGHNHHGDIHRHAVGAASTNRARAQGRWLRQRHTDEERDNAVHDRSHKPRSGQGDRHTWVHPEKAIHMSIAADKHLEVSAV